MAMLLKPGTPEAESQLLAIHWFPRAVITDSPNGAASTSLLRLLCRLNHTVHIKPLATPYNFTRSRYRSISTQSMIFQTGSAEIPNITRVPLPWGQMWQCCQFLEDFLGSSPNSFLGQWIQPSWVSLLETNPTTNERENEQLLCCWNRERTSPLTYSALGAPSASSLQHQPLGALWVSLHSRF